MGEFYGKKIQSGEINPKTGETWKFEDVSSYWKPKVKKWLESTDYNKEQ